MRRVGGTALGLLIVAAFVAGCGGGSDPPSATPTQPAPTATSVPTATPAPPPTPEPTLPPPQPGAYGLTQALPGANFQRMVDFAVIPGSDGEAVVVTQDGGMWKVALAGGAPAEPFGDLSDRLQNATGSEEGLLGLAFSPEFESDGRVYLYYTIGSPEPSVLSRFQVANGVLDEASEKVLLEAPQPFRNHNGGRVAFGPDGYLYLGLGDGGSGGDPQGHGQDISELLGSILRIDVSGEDYAVPADNPFADTRGAAPEVYAYGLRNPWRFSFDRETGDLWAGDVGQNAWEEVDRIEPGGNYGWNIMEGPECFAADSCDTSGLALPRAAYSHEDGCSVTGGYVYRGGALPELNGWYVYGDFCSGNLWAVNTTDDSDAVLVAATGQAISSFAELPDGELLVITFGDAIYRLTRAS